jgi:thiamine-phosphate pyrophosphorylase
MVEQRLTTNTCVFYYITDRNAFPGDEAVRRRRLLEKIAEAARAAVDYIQLREKDLPTRELESLAAEAVRVIRENPKHGSGSLRTENQELRTALVINSRSDVAIAVGADGIHLRSEDISPQQVRRIWEPAGSNPSLRKARGVGQSELGESSKPRNDSIRTALIGVSCHSPEEVMRAAANGASFAVFGPVFEKGGSAPTGLGQLREACKAGIPVLALGGVTLGNAQSCLDAGAAGIAGIRLFQENDIGSVVRKLRERAVL